MRFLIDTNILIKLEPPTAVGAESDAVDAMEINRLVARGDHQLLIHPNIRDDIGRDGDAERRERNTLLLNKYNVLGGAPSLESLPVKFNEVPPGTNEHVDNSLIAAVFNGAVHYLITEDVGIHRKMRKLDLSDRCLLISHAAELLRSLYDVDVLPPPLVEESFMHALDLTDPIWETFREDYPEFDDWFTRVRSEGRKCWIIHRDGSYAGVALVKPETEAESGLPGKTLKVTSFKVAEGHRGAKLGELLLRTIFQFAISNQYDQIYLTVFPHHIALVVLLEDFGFSQLPNEAGDDVELVYTKRLVATDTETRELDKLTYHVKFGPPALHPGPSPTYLVPVRPEWHRMLFPDLERTLYPDHGTQLVLETAGQAPVTPGAHGNAIKKAYLSNSPLRKMKAGDTLLFYRSDDLKAAVAVGVVDDTLVSEDTAEIASFVGARTVYSIPEIERLAAREVLAILFRYDRSIDPPIFLHELIHNNAVGGAPQSISSVAAEGDAWIQKRIRE